MACRPEQHGSAALCARGQVLSLFGRERTVSGVHFFLFCLSLFGLDDMVAEDEGEWLQVSGSFLGFAWDVCWVVPLSTALRQIDLEVSPLSPARPRERWRSDGVSGEEAFRSRW